MYSVVVCPKCENVWIIEDMPETSKCGRCGHTRTFKRYKKYAKNVSKDEAKMIRAKALAQQNDQEELFERAAESGALTSDRVDVVGDTELLDEKGVDADEVSEASKSKTTTQSRSQKQIIQDAVSEQDTPTEDEVLEYAMEYGVSRAKASKLLEKLMMVGDVRRVDGGFREV